MNIVHLLPHIGQGGDWTIVRGLIEIFSKKGHKLTLCGANASGKAQQAINLELNRGLWGSLSSLRKMHKFPASVDILHAHSISTAVYASIVKVVMKNRPRLVYTFHWAVRPSQAKRLMIRFLYGFIDEFHVYSIEAKKFLLRHYAIPEGRIRLAYVGVNADRFDDVGQASKSALRSFPGIDQDKFVLLSVGRLAPEKGIDQIFLALSQSTLSDVVAVVVGSGDQKAELEALARRSGVEDRILFVPHTDRVEDYYRAADLLVLPSVALETFGLVVVEAALCGLPTVRSDLPGAKDQIVDGKTGFVYSPPESTALAEKIELILREKHNLEQIGQNARAHALEHFTYETMYENMLAVYRGE